VPLNSNLCDLDAVLTGHQQQEGPVNPHITGATPWKIVLVRIPQRSINEHMGKELPGLLLGMKHDMAVCFERN
jgi:hypothetical protein